MRQPEAQVILSTETASAVTVHLRAWIDEEGLVIEGQDLGPLVSSVWGDSDYEYWLRVDRTHFDRLHAAMAGKLDREPAQPADQVVRDRLLLDSIKEAWTRDLFKTDVDFRQWLDSINVPSKFSSYA